MACSLNTGWLRLPVCEHAILNVALQIQPTRPCLQRGPRLKQAPPPSPGPAPSPPQNGLVPRVQKDAHHAGNQDFCREMSSSDPEWSGQMWDIATVLSPPPLLLFLPFPPTHPPICHSTSSFFFASACVTGSAASPNQEHSSPMRWHERPTLRSSFTILRTASSRPRPRWSNRQSCCSGRRWSMQNT